MGLLPRAARPGACPLPTFSPFRAENCSVQGLQVARRVEGVTYGTRSPPYQAGKLSRNYEAVYVDYHACGM
jgi:hypothetical protein